MINYSYTLKQIIDKAVRSLDLISESEYTSKQFPKKWSKKEILGHLIDSAINNLNRFTRVTTKNSYTFEPYNQDKWVEINNYENRQGEELINLWASINHHIAALISKIPEDVLKQKTTEHNFDEICMLMVAKGSESSLSYLIWDYLYHMEHHLSQIISNYDYELTNFNDDK